MHDIKIDIRMGRTLEDMAIHDSLRNKQPQQHKIKQQSGPPQQDKYKKPQQDLNQTGPVVTLANYPQEIKKALEAAEKATGGRISTFALFKAAGITPDDLARENICTKTDCRTILIRGSCNCLRAKHPKPSTAALEKFTQMLTPGLAKAKSMGPAFVTLYKRK